VSHDAPQPAHPLAEALAEALTDLRPAHVLLIGAGDGRNLAPFRAHAIVVYVVPAGGSLADLTGPFDGVLSTHDLLHGTRRAVAARLSQLRALLAPDGRLYATFGSARDPRCGAGDAIGGGDGWAQRAGDEAGIVHAYFDEPGLRAALAGFTVVSIAERDVTQIAGRWAHARGDGPVVHWLVEARRTGLRDG
jgi:hypothetical protein